MVTYLIALISIINIIAKSKINNKIYGLFMIYGVMIDSIIFIALITKLLW